jgi:hypothetical protein
MEPDRTYPPRLFPEKGYLGAMKKIAAVILTNPDGELLLYLRDNKPGLPFPHHWDLFGGMWSRGRR